MRHHRIFNTLVMRINEVLHMQKLEGTHTIATVLNNNLKGNYGGSLHTHTGYCTMNLRSGFVNWSRVVAQGGGHVRSDEEILTFWTLSSSSAEGCISEVTKDVVHQEDFGFRVTPIEEGNIRNASRRINS